MVNLSRYLYNFYWIISKKQYTMLLKNNPCIFIKHINYDKFLKFQCLQNLEQRFLRFLQQNCIGSINLVMLYCEICVIKTFKNVKVETRKNNTFLNILKLLVILIIYYKQSKHLQMFKKKKNTLLFYTSSLYTYLKYIMPSNLLPIKNSCALSKFKKFNHFFYLFQINKQAIPKSWSQLLI